MEPLIIKGGIFVDDRGIIRFVNYLDMTIKRMYQVSNHRKGFIRAWHGHKIELKIAYVVKGSVEFGLINMENNSDKQIYYLSDCDPRLLCIPPGYYNGFKTLTDDAIILFFSNCSLEESKDDDYRLSYETYQLFEEKYR